MASYLDRAARAPGTAQQPWTEEVENVDNLSTIVDKLSTWASNRRVEGTVGAMSGGMARAARGRRYVASSIAAVWSDAVAGAARKARLLCLHVRQG